MEDFTLWKEAYGGGSFYGLQRGKPRVQRGVHFYSSEFMREFVKANLQCRKCQEMAVRVMMQEGLSSTGIGGTNIPDDQEESTR